MIHIVLLGSHAYTVRPLITQWEPSLAERVRCVDYDDLAHARRVRAGTWVFADLERLSGARLELAMLVADQLRAAGMPVLNHPRTVLRREPLLRRLRELGLNPHSVYKAAAGVKPARFPVFVRRPDDHCGPVGQLLPDQAALDAELARLGPSSGGMVVIEFIDTRGTDGLYRKYSVLRIGDAFIPRHILTSRNWALKLADIVNDQTVAEEREYWDSRPHEDEVRRVFEVADIGYGRIDYALSDGKVVTWEVNTNPVVITGPMKIDPLRLGQQVTFVKATTEAMERLDDAGPTSGDVPLHIPKAIVRRLGVRPHHWLYEAVVRLARSTERWPLGARLARRLRQASSWTDLG